MSYAPPKSLADMSPTEVADYVYRFLVKQGEPSFDENRDYCAYRGETSSGSPAMCAAGCLIADEHYDPSMEGKAIGELVRCGLDVPGLSRHERLLRALQTAHDIWGGGSLGLINEMIECVADIDNAPDDITAALEHLQKIRGEV